MNKTLIELNQSSDLVWVMLILTNGTGRTKSGPCLSLINVLFDFLCTKKEPKMTISCIVELSQKNCWNNFNRTTRIYSLLFNVWFKTGFVAILNFFLFYLNLSKNFFCFNFSSRMTCWGFGCCTVTLLRKDSLAETTKTIIKKYQKLEFHQKVKKIRNSPSTYAILQTEQKLFNNILTFFISSAFHNLELQLSSTDWKFKILHFKYIFTLKTIFNL